MLGKVNLITALLLLTIGSLRAQKLELCSTYDSSGKAAKALTSTELPAKGKALHLLYSQPTVPVKGNWSLQITYDKEMKGIYSPLTSYTLRPRAAKKWMAQPHVFTQPGKYKATVKFNNVVKSSTAFTLTTPVKKQITEDEPDDTYYFEESELLFCKSVDKDGEPDGQSDTFQLNAAGKAEVTVYLYNDKGPFKTSGLYVEIYSEDNSEKLEDYTIDVQPDWNFVHFRQTFTKPGKYVFDIYTANDVFVNSATVTIVK